MSVKKMSLGKAVWAFFQFNGCCRRVQATVHNVTPGQVDQAWRARQ